MRRNFLNKMMFKLRVKTGYNVKKKEKSYYRKQFINIIICIIIILMVIVLRNINSKPTDKVIQVVKNTLNHDTDIISSSKNAINNVIEVVTNNDKVMEVFNFKGDDEVVDYIIPVRGSVYREFGEEEKPNNITVFNKGIDILSKDDEVVSIGNGEIIDINEDRILNKVIRIDYGEFVAKYGYIEKAFISPGQKINKGDKIGNLITNKGERKILYLELQKDGMAIDPLSKINFTSSNLVAR